jgi:PhnB protein
MNVEPYLFFDGKCEEALQFYRKALGAEVLFMMRFKDSPEPMQGGHTPPADKVMHASFKVGDTMVMASDGYCSGKPSFQGFSLTVNVPTPAEAEKRFAMLAEGGGQVQQPLTETFFAQRFGMVADRFGVSWMLLAGPKNP